MKSLARYKPTNVDPRALEALEKLNVSTEELRSKSIDAFSNERLDYIIALCGKAAAECKASSSAGKFMAWDLMTPDKREP